MFKLEGRPLPLDTPFIAGDVQYPANWLRLTTAEEKAAIGITEEADPEIYDDRFYWGVGIPKQLEDRLEVKEDGTPLMVQRYDEETESMVDTNKQVVHKGLKSLYITQTNDTANKLLSATDWMIIRKAERNVDVPAKTLALRAAIIAESNRLTQAIQSCTSVEELIAVINSQKWVSDDT